MLVVSAEARLSELELVLPPEPKSPPGVPIPFEWVRVVGLRCLVSGHGALNTAGAPTGPFGRVPSEVSLEDAQASAHAATLASLAALRRTIGSLDRVAAWLMINGYVNADEGYSQTTAVLNPVSNLILDVFGPDIGSHARTAIGVRALPLTYRSSSALKYCWRRSRRCGSDGVWVGDRGATGPTGCTDSLRR